MVAYYNEHGVILSITNDDGYIARFEFKNMHKAIKFAKQFYDTTDETIRDIELHEIALPNYE